MTIQDKIDEVVGAVAGALEKSQIQEDEKAQILDGVKALGFQWQEANAHGRAACILLGLLDGHYSPDLMVKFVRECVELKQFDELSAKEIAGSYFTFKKIPMPEYAALIDLLMVQAIEGEAGEYQEKVGYKKPKVELVYDPAIADEYRAEQEAKAGEAAADKSRNGGNVKHYVEVADQLPEEAKADADNHTETVKAPARKQAGVKTAARVAAAGKKTVAQTRKKTTGAADGK